MKPSAWSITAVAAIIAGCVSGDERPVSIADEAPQYAESVVLVRRVVSNDRVHTYVKEVWRTEPGGEQMPSDGSEYGEPVPYDARVPHPERDAIVFVFGADRPAGLPKRWTTTVTAEGLVPSFTRVVYDQRGMRGNTDPDLVSQPHREPMSVQEVKRLVLQANRKTVA